MIIMYLYNVNIQNDSLENYIRCVMILIEENDDLSNSIYDINNSNNIDILVLYESLINVFYFIQYGSNSDDECYMMLSIHLISPLLDVKPIKYPKEFKKYFSNFVRCFPIILEPIESSSDIIEIYEDLQSCIYNFINLLSILLLSNEGIEIVLNGLLNNINYFQRIKRYFNIIYSKLIKKKYDESKYESFFISFDKIIIKIKSLTVNKEEYKNIYDML